MKVKEAISQLTCLVVDDPALDELELVVIHGYNDHPIKSIDLAEADPENPAVVAVTI